MLVTKALLIIALICALGTAACAGAEVRGAWVTSWQSGFFTPQQIDDTVAATKKAGLNALFIEVRRAADAFYDSKIEPRPNEIAADFDPLAYTIKKAHAAGIQVHAWVVVYRAWSGAKTGPTDPNHIINKHPDWVMLSNTGKNWADEGIYLDPGVPEARDYIVSVFEDIAKRYDVDGIQYDYVRYPGKNWGYSEAALKHYYADTGSTAKPAPDDPKWLQWRRDQVTALVKESRDKIKAANPRIQISASTICYGKFSTDWEKTEAYSDVLQDWYLWMREGLIDINIPMNYRSENDPAAAQSYRNWINASEQWNGGRLVYQGIYCSSNSPADVLKQIDAMRKAGQEGFVLFAFNSGRRRAALADALGAGLGAAPVVRLNEPIALCPKE